MSDESGRMSRSFDAYKRHLFDTMGRGGTWPYKGKRFRPSRIKINNQPLKELELDEIFIEGLDIRNFRGFSPDTNEIPLSKVNLVFGPNSGGKSTILKALASFPQTLSENRNNVELERKGNWVSNGPWFDLGTESTVIHKSNKEQTKKNSFSSERKFSIGFTVRSRKTKLEKLDFEIRENEDHFNVEFKIPDNINESIIPKLFYGGTPTFDSVKKIETKMLFGGSQRGKRKLMREIQNILDERGYPQISCSITHGHLLFYDTTVLFKLRNVQRILHNMHRQLIHRMSNPRYRNDDEWNEYDVDRVNRLLDRARTIETGFSANIHTKEFLQRKSEELREFMTILIDDDGDFQNPTKGFSKLRDRIKDIIYEEWPSLSKELLERILNSCFGFCVEADEGKLWKLNYEFLYGNNQDSSVPLTGLLLESENNGEFEHCMGIDLEEYDYFWDLDDETKNKLGEDANEIYFAKQREEIVDCLHQFIIDSEMEDSREWELFLRSSFYDYNSVQNLANFGDLDIHEEISTLELKDLISEVPGKILFKCINFICSADNQSLSGDRDIIQHRVQYEDMVPDENNETMAEIFGLKSKKDKRDFVKMLNQHELTMLSDELADLLFKPKLFDVNSFSWTHEGANWPRPDRVNGILVGDAIKIIEKISNEVSKFVIEIDYLGANRLSPQRYFERVSSSTRRAGIAGNRSISSLANVVGRNMPKTERFNQMTEKVIGKTIKFNNIKGTNYRLFEVLVSNSDGTSGELNLADVGHGISQCIPLIGSTLTDSVLLCEEAESNLHPAAQARLMTTLLESYSEKDAGGNPLMILETHSEHFLKALLRHLETGEGLSDEDVCVLYVEEQDGRTVVKRIRTKDGEFVDPWPRNRWDDETNPII